MKFYSIKCKILYYKIIWKIQNKLWKLTEIIKKIKITTRNNCPSKVRPQQGTSTARSVPSKIRPQQGLSPARSVPSKVRPRQGRPQQGPSPTRSVPNKVRPQQGRPPARSVPEKVRPQQGPSPARPRRLNEIYIINKNNKKLLNYFEKYCII